MEPEHIQAPDRVGMDMPKVPDRFICPIQSDVMYEPCKLKASGKVYDRAAIELHLLRQLAEGTPPSCPITRLPVDMADAFEPTHELHMEILLWCEVSGHPPASPLTLNPPIQSLLLASPDPATRQDTARALTDLMLPGLPLPDSSAIKDTLEKMVVFSRTTDKPLVKHLLGYVYVNYYLAGGKDYADQPTNHGPQLLADQLSQQNSVRHLAQMLGTLKDMSMLDAAVGCISCFEPQHGPDLLEGGVPNTLATLVDAAAIGRVHAQAVAALWHLYAFPEPSLRAGVQALMFDEVQAMRSADPVLQQQSVYFFLHMTAKEVKDVPVQALITLQLVPAAVKALASPHDGVPGVAVVLLHNLTAFADLRLPIAQADFVGTLLHLAVMHPNVFPAAVEVLSALCDTEAVPLLAALCCQLPLLQQLADVLPQQLPAAKRLQRCVQLLEAAKEDVEVLAAMQRQGQRSPRKRPLATEEESDADAMPAAQRLRLDVGVPAQLQMQMPPAAAAQLQVQQGGPAAAGQPQAAQPQPQLAAGNLSAQVQAAHLHIQQVLMQRPHVALQLQAMVNHAALHHQLPTGLAPELLAAHVMVTLVQPQLVATLAPPAAHPTTHVTLQPLGVPHQPPPAPHPLFHAPPAHHSAFAASAPALAVPYPQLAGPAFPPAGNSQAPPPPHPNAELPLAYALGRHLPNLGDVMNPNHNVHAQQVAAAQQATVAQQVAAAQQAAVAQQAAAARQAVQLSHAQGLHAQGLLAQGLHAGGVNFSLVSAGVPAPVHLGFPANGGALVHAAQAVPQPATLLHTGPHHHSGAFVLHLA